MNLPKKYANYQAHKSIYHALSGIRLAFLREFNLILQLTIGIFTSGVSLYFGHWLFAFANVVMMGIVISLEMMNTAFETLCDLVNLDFDHRIKTIKDIAAASVLVSSFVWLVVLTVEVLVVVFQIKGVI